MSQPTIPSSQPSDRQAESNQASTARWLDLCPLSQAPTPGRVVEAEIEGIAICLANLDGTLSALDNWCPHRRGPLGQGWIEGTAVICPWHSWAFNVHTGLADYPEGEQVAVFPVRIQASAVQIDLSETSAAKLLANSSPNPK